MQSGRAKIQLLIYFLQSFQRFDYENKNASNTTGEVKINNNILIRKVKQGKKIKN